MTTDDTGDVPSYDTLIERQRKVVDKLQRSVLGAGSNPSGVEQVTNALGMAIDRLAELRRLATENRGRQGP